MWHRHWSVESEGMPSRFWLHQQENQSTLDRYTETTEIAQSMQLVTYLDSLSCHALVGLRGAVVPRPRSKELPRTVSDA